MLDFFIPYYKKTKNGAVIYPKFIIKKSSDLMIRGGDFYAIWDEDRKLWSTDEEDVIRIIDSSLKEFKEQNYKNEDVSISYMWDSESGSIDSWHKYCQKQTRDSYHMLDEKIIFSNMEISKKDYASKRLSYPLEEGSIDSYNKLISTLYSDEERHKIEWAIGSIVTGDSKSIQKFLVLYGAAGTGKSTILNIIQQLFDGYYSVFDAKALGSSSNSFALEAFKSNPLVAIQHDGDLSRIEDNTRLNSLVSHELMTVNEKFKSTYSNRFKAFLFMGTNKPVKITDGKSGLIRRLIDVTPSGNKLSPREYKKATDNIKFELGAIAYHCMKVYLDDPGAYDDYMPISMLGASNDFYNFVIDSYHIFKKDNGTTLKAAWEMYKVYCEDAKVQYPFSQRNFKEELKNYFWDYDDRLSLEDGSRVRSYYSGFREDKFEENTKEKKKEDKHTNLIEFKEQKSKFDILCKDCYAQYASSKETPLQPWDEVTTTLNDISTDQLHYVKIPENHIVIDFDIKDNDGNKSFELNLEAASKWPSTYAELSKSGAGIHLHYIYTGDPSKLSRVYDDNIEIKVFSGKSSLRRKLTKCNDIPVATISSGLPLKGDPKVIDTNVVTTEKGIRTTIKKCLNKEIHAGTKPNVDFIFSILEKAYNSGLKYDVSDMYNAILSFAINSTHQSEYCINMVSKMHFKSDEPSTCNDSEQPIVFYDIEVFPNLLLVNWKYQGEKNPVVRMFNPSSEEIEKLMQYKLIGFNNKRYDNHIIWARLLGYSNEELYSLSQRIIENVPNSTFAEAYNVSYTDIYDFASAGNKKSLKKLEIEMGIHHQELGLPWDKPVPEEKWEQVALYCDNDVIATEAAFNYLSADWTARQILAELACGSVNDSTNSLTTKFIFGNNKKPQSEFQYRDLSKPVTDLDPDVKNFLELYCPDMMKKKHYGNIIPFGESSYLPYFEGYKFENGKSTYRGIEVGEGGCVIATPGMYGNVALLDIASMHPHSIIAECLFGPKYTRAFRDVVEGRVSIKHKAWDEVNEMLDGKLTPFVEKCKNGEMSVKDLANGLKTAINAVYGLTAATFDNPFRDPRNIDNIVAKRGALFMIDLKNEVEERGYCVAHIKTDSIKIPDATPEIINFVMEFGKRHGYAFEHEATYEKMCLVNDAVYIAKYATKEKCERLYGYCPDNNCDHGGQWTATGTQFAVPYVFKTLFSKEKIEFKDMCETFAVSKGDLYLDRNEELQDVSSYEKELDKVRDNYKKGKISDTTYESEVSRLEKLIEPGHNYIFIGRVGLFCPIKDGYDAGTLYRINEGKKYAAPGSKDYKWLESEYVKTLHLEDAINKDFYKHLVDAAVETISKYCDFEWFASDDPYVQDPVYIPPNSPEEIPFV